MAAKKTATQRAKGPKVPTVVPAHGRGALSIGGTPGNKGGTGRPPDAIRAAMREKLEEALPKLWSKYKRGKLDDIAFANFLARYGLGSKELVITSANAAGFFECVHRAIVERYGDEAGEAIKGRAIALMDGNA